MAKQKAVAVPCVYKKRKSRILRFVFMEAVIIGLFAVVYFIIIRPAADGKENKSLLTQSGFIDERMIQVRNDQYQLIKPLRLSDIHESDQLSHLKCDISQLIENKKQAGVLYSASVYYRKLNDGTWIGVNNNETFRPGSISKIPLLMYYLKLSELKPGLLDQKYTYNKVYMESKQETYQNTSVKLGDSYTVRDLLKKMITESDNGATSLLLSHLDNTSLYESIFRELHMPVPKKFSFDFALTASDCSKFLRVLYNSTYLSDKNSEFALQLLSHTTFKEGIKKALPENVTVANKFGESGFEDAPEFSETGIIFEGENSYLLTVMTRGVDSKGQAEAISEISKLVYDRVNETP
jgi:beta-lactamase class A